MTSFPGLQDYFDKKDVLFSADPWAILGTDKLAGYMSQVSIIGHKCSSFEVVQFLDEEDSLRGECWWCKTSIPDEIQALWQLHNMDKIPSMTRYPDEVGGNLTRSQERIDRFEKGVMKVWGPISNVREQVK